MFFQSFCPGGRQGSQTSEVTTKFGGDKSFDDEDNCHGNDGNHVLGSAGRLVSGEVAARTVEVGNRLGEWKLGSSGLFI